MSHYLLDDVNQNEDSFLCMLGENTPIKDCTGFSCDMMNIGSMISSPCMLVVDFVVNHVLHHEK